MAAPKKKQGRGRPPKLGNHVATTLRLSKALHASLRLYAAAQRKSVNDIVVEVIEAWWSRQSDRGQYERLASKSRAGQGGGT